MLQLASPTGTEFAVFLGCIVALMGMVALLLSVISQTKKLFFTPKVLDGEKPVTEAEFERRMELLKRDLLAEINRPNLNYVTQAQLEAKLDRLEASVSRKIDDGGAYAHQREHAFNNSLNALQLKVERILVQVGGRPGTRGALDTTQDLI